MEADSSPDNMHRPAGPPGSARFLIAATIGFPAGARLALGLSQAGCIVDAICPRSHPLVAAESVRRLYRYGALDPLLSLARAIQADPATIVIPCDDQAMLHLHRLHDRARRHKRTALAGAIERSLGRPGSWRIAASRAAVMQTAADAGVRAPPGGAVTEIADLRLRYHRLPLPWVLKGDGTWGGAGVQVVHSRDQAEQALLTWRGAQRMKAAKHLLVNREAFAAHRLFPAEPGGIVIQQFIEGTPANTLAVCDRGDVISAISVEVLQFQQPNGAATVIRPIRHAEMEECAIRMVRALGLSGLCGFDFILAPAGEAFFIEMNARNTQIGHLNLGPGRNLVAALVRHLAQQPCRETPAIDRETIALFPQAWCQDPTSAWLHSAHHDVPWEDAGLLRELMRLPWHERGLLARALRRMRATRHGRAPVVSGIDARCIEQGQQP